MLNNKKAFDIFILLSIFSFIIIFYNYQFNSDIILGGDEWEISYDSKNLIENFNSGWVSTFNLGNRNLDKQNIFPIIAISKFLNLFFSNEISLKIYSIIWSLLISCSLYVFLKKLNCDDITISICIILYSINELTISNSLSYNIKIVLFLIPILSYLIINIKNENYIIKTSIYINIFLLFSIQTLGNISIIASIFLYIFILSCLHFYIEKINFKKLIIFFTLTLFIYLIINFYFIFNIINNLLNISDNLVKTSGFRSIRNSEVANIYNLLIGGGYWAAQTGMDGNHKYVPLLNNLYKYSYYIILNLIPLIFIFYYSINYKQNLKNDFIKFFTVYIVFIFLAKGIREPIGYIYKILYENINLLTAFRDPWSKFIPYSIFSYITLIAISINSINRIIKFAILIILILFVIIFVNKNIYYNDNYGIMRSVHVSIPNYWKDLNYKFSVDSNNGRTLLLPKSMNGSYLWENGLSTSMPIVSLFYKHDLIFYPGYTNRGNSGDDLIKYLYNEIFNIDKLLIKKYANESLEFAINKITFNLEIDKYTIYKFFNILNINYVFLQNDFNWYPNFIDGSFPPSINNKIVNKLNLKVVYESSKFNLNNVNNGRNLNLIENNLISKELNLFPQIQIFELDKKYQSERIYSPKNILTYDNSFEDFISVLKKNNDYSKQLYINKNLINGDDLKQYFYTDINFYKINDNHYKIECNSNKKFILVFNENYDVKWKLYQNNKLIDNKYHGNYYSQFWIVTPNNARCELNLVYD